MLRLKEAIDEKTLTTLQRMLMQFLHSSTALYEADGTYVYGVFEGEYCELLNKVSYENEGSNEEEVIGFKKWICQEDCWNMSRLSIQDKEPIEMECSGGIKVYAVPIIYKEQVIGSINAGITNPPLKRKKLEQVSQKYGIDIDELAKNAYQYRSMSKEETEIARLQLRMAALLISSLYESKLKQIEAEKQLLLRNNQLQAVIENVSNGVFIYNKDKYISFMNDESRKFFSNNPDTIQIGESLKNTEYYDINGNRVEYSNLPANRVIKGEKLTNLFITAVRSDATIHFNINGSPIYDDNGEIISALICTHEVTELVNDKKKLQQQKDQLEAIVDNMSDGLSIFDGSGKYIFFNRAAKAMFFPSYKYMNKAGDGLHQAKYFNINGEEVPFESYPANRVKRGEKFIGMRLKIKFPDKPLYISISGTPIYDSQNRLVMGILCSRDVSDIVNYESRLEEKNKQLDAVLENMAEGVIISDALGNVLGMNAAALEIHGIKSLKDPISIVEFTENFYLTDFEGKQIPFAQWPVLRALKGEVFNNNELWVCRKDKAEKKLCSYSGTAIYNSMGQMTMAVITLRDITIQRSQHQLLLQSEREKNAVLESAMKMKDEFLANITHEFKTPLTVINAALQTIDNIYGSEVTPNIRKHMQRIRTNTLRQIRLVNNLLDITRYNAGHIKLYKENLDIIFLTNSIINSVDLFSRQKGIELKFFPEHETIVMAIDEEKYERILLNLLSNAIKFTPRDKTIYVNITKNENEAVITVKDEGVGIPKNKQKLIFERFGQVDTSLTRQAEGTGIGLSLVKSLVESLNGTIRVQSEVHKGSTFIVTLPIIKMKKQSKEFQDGLSYDNRVMQATAIEFSDIYLD